MTGGRLERRIRAAGAEGRAALLPYLVAGYPRRRGFEQLLLRVAARADVLELGLPFSDPTADGPLIAAAGGAALAQGVHLSWVCELASDLQKAIAPGLVLMSYLNPLLAPGLERSLARLAASGFEGLIVPDLPLEESGELRGLAGAHGLALIQLVTPLTPRARRARLARASRGFLYAVTRPGTTGAPADAHAAVPYLRDLRAASPLPVCAGFGLRAPEQVHALAGACDGLVVGSVLVECLRRGADPAELLDGLRTAARAEGARSSSPS
jgi:tryptophan synthase alpha chain